MYKRILIVVDQRPVCQAAIHEGTALAAATGAEVLFLTLLPRYTVPVADGAIFAAVPAEEFLESAKENATRALDEASAIAAAAGVLSQRCTSDGEGDAQCIVDHALQADCGLIVVASQGRNAVMRLLSGSAVPGLITLSPIPVLVCKSRVGEEVHVESAQPQQELMGAAELPMQ